MEDEMTTRTVRTSESLRSSQWTDRGLLLMRIALGLVFVMHGGQKLFVFGHAGVASGMAALGLPFPGLSAALIMAVELGGGVALLAGAFTRVAAFLIAGAMAVATVSAHLANGFFMPSGFEYTLTLMLTSLGVLMTGPGAYSVDSAWVAPEQTKTPSYRVAA
jgi:putative oxidoreductase